MLVNIFGTLIFVIGIHAPAQGGGCFINSREKNTEYSTAISCERVLEIINTQRKESK